MHIFLEKLGINYLSVFINNNNQYIKGNKIYPEIIILHDFKIYKNIL